MNRGEDRSTVKILFVDEDSDQVARVTEAFKREGFLIKTAGNGEEALSVFEDWNPSIVLLDVNLPSIDGHHILKLIRRQNNFTSVVFLSGNSQVEDIISGLDAGADDYICKPFNVLELLARVRVLVRLKNLHDELEKTNQKLRELVDTDDLTGLFNMRSLYERLDNEIFRAHRFQRSVAVVMIDMDFFKKVNDTNDHLFGSYALSEVGKIIKNQVRRTDIAARYGGDEFLVVLTETNLEGAQHLCERLRQKIANHLFSHDGNSMKLTASFGCAVTRPFLQKIDAKILVKVLIIRCMKRKRKVVTVVVFMI